MLHWLVGITGLAGSGKSTVARMLCEEPGVIQIAFADPLKDFVAGVYDWPREKLDDLEFKETPDPRYGGLTPRRALQTLGTEWGRGCYENTWVDLGIRRAEWWWAQGTPMVVISDCRFQNEVDAIIAAQGMVLRVHRPGLLRGAHASEQTHTLTGIAIEIDNGGSLVDLKAAVQALYPRFGRRDHLAGESE